MRPLPLLGLIIPVLISSSLHGAILVNETFADGDRVVDSPPNSLQWTYGAHRSSEAFTSLTVGSNQMVWDHTSAAGNSFSGIWGHFTAGGSPVSLAVGETLRLSFSVSFAGGSFSSSTGGFRWALLDSNNSRVITDFAGANESGLSSGTTFSSWRGYEGQTAVHSATVTTGLLTRERGGTGNGLFTGSNWTGLSGSSVTSPITAASTLQSAFLEITRTSATAMSVQAGYGGVVTNLVSDAATPRTTFDTIAFFTLDSLTHDITLSNIQLELIPEPSAALLGGIGLVSLLVRRRR